MAPRILIAEPVDFSPQALEILEQAAEVDLRASGRDGLAAAMAQYDAIWVRLGQRIDRDLLSLSARCRIIATPVTGLDHVDLDTCRERGIEVVSLRGETEFLRNVRATAELTLGILLALLRRIPAAAEHVKQGAWDRDHFRGHELYGKTAGIVGVGRLGTIVARYLQALGMDVQGYDPTSDFPMNVARRCDSLASLLATSDVVSLHVPYNESTRHMIGAAQLASMRESAVLVNTSRGGVVDGPALLDALRKGHLAGAALDVLEDEPHITSRHPLVEYARTRDNLLIVPHIGGNTAESFAKTEVFLAQRVVEALGRLQDGNV